MDDLTAAQLHAYEEAYRRAAHCARGCCSFRDPSWGVDDEVGSPFDAEPLCPNRATDIVMSAWEGVLAVDQYCPEHTKTVEATVARHILTRPI